MRGSYMGNIRKVVSLLKELGRSVSTMESCTGGGLANAITNVEGASDVFEFSAVTYSNDFKIKMGVDSSVIEKYSVYSVETARSMSKAISDYAKSTYGIGITGKINRVDKKNPYGEDNVVFFSIYDSINDKYYTSSLEAMDASRKDNKKYIIEEVGKLFLSILE